MMWKRWLALALVAVAWVHAEEELRSKSKICANVFCGAGRECAVTEKGEPTCLCIEQCKPHKRPVCGSNGKTYLNHCELHRDACLTGSKIQVDYDGHCKEKKPVSPSASPVVCYQSNRDELRRRIIQWLEAEIVPDGWFSKGSNYSEILDKYFKNFDNGDSRLDSSEFLKFVEQNETAINITTYADQENNKLLRGLCIDALIELSDENADWKLSFQEFLKCLNPSFNPPEKKCALEDETYADGAETEVDCNRCVCACGNWVCTAMTCDGELCLRQRKEQHGENVLYGINMREARAGMVEKSAVAGKKDAGSKSWAQTCNVGAPSGQLEAKALMADALSSKLTPEPWHEKDQVPGQEKMLIEIGVVTMKANTYFVLTVCQALF
ncbi:follistatin-related protein 1 isoform X2 [Choloepus didactylus]|uniref:follistatin-related protein 1 isoform X2 n=1 Tax=Choloepus didactylus TaxID=27675 RepID=UPI00189D84C8|nr:follistatin-related protein 1 isoform X2 [Choloepus didactylus]